MTNIVSQKPDFYWQMAFWLQCWGFLICFMQLKRYIKSANLTFISLFVYTKTLWCRFWILSKKVHLRVWECFDVFHEAASYSFEPNTTERRTCSCSRWVLIKNKYLPNRFKAGACQVCILVFFAATCVIITSNLIILSAELTFSQTN